MSPEERTVLLKERAVIRDVLVSLVRDAGGKVDKKNLLDEGEKKTGKSRREVYSALRSSEDLIFNRTIVRLWPLRDGKRVSVREAFAEIGK